MDNKVLLGKDNNGNDFILDLDSAQNVLLTGTTGAGKSICLHRILFTLLNNNKNAEYVLIDPKCVEFSKYQKLSNVTYFTYKQYPEMVECLNKFLEKEELTNDVFIFVDEMCDVGDVDQKYIKPFLNILKTDNKHIHLIYASQRICCDSMKKLKKYTPNRLGFCTSSLAESLSTIGKGGLEKLKGCGDCIALIDGKLAHLNVDMISRQEINDLIDNLN